MDAEPTPVHDTWDEFMEMERACIQEHASGKMARALGHALPGETQEELERIAAEDQRLAQQGMVKLKSRQRVYFKHIDELTREDRKARIAAEREQVDWLMKRVGLRKERSS
jgi:ABC-type glutathione transport system ATPase component